MPLTDSTLVRLTRRLPRLGAFGLLPVLLCIIIASSHAGEAPILPPGTGEVDALRRTPVVRVIEQARAAVVNIQSERNAVPGTGAGLGAGAGAGEGRVNGMGTGVVIDPRGLIVTNNHVVEDVTVLRVRLADGTQLPARVIARDHETDLAIIKVDPPRPLPTLHLGTANDLIVGEPAIVIGNAFGYEHTASAGIISAKGRDVTLNKEMAYRSLIQTDAAINPGNSGGPLLNIHGELIGVVVAIRAGAQNIGFAIPVDTVLRVSSRLLAERRLARGLGSLATGLVLRDEVDTTTHPVQRRLVVDRVEPGTPASQAGFQVGDVVREVGGTAISHSLDLERVLLDRKSGDKLTVRVQRGGNPALREVGMVNASLTSIELTLGGTERKALSPAEAIWQRLGVRLQPAPPEVVTRVNAQLHGGLIITDVASDSPARRVGLQRGDILIGLHQWETLSLENVNFVLNHPDRANFSPLRFFLIRNGTILQGHLRLND
jgi:serine protease Do